MSQGLRFFSAPFISQPSVHPGESAAKKGEREDDLMVGDGIAGVPLRSTVLAWQYQT